MNVKYVVELNTEEREALVVLTSKGKESARKLKRAQLLLLVDCGKRDKEIVELLNISTSTIYRTKKRFVEDGLTEALNEGSRAGCPRKLDAVSDALLTAIACSEPPEGCGRWTLNAEPDSR